MSKKSTKNKPLAKVKSKETIAELFAMDPLKLTDDDLGRMAEAMREGQAAWAKEEKQAKLAGRKPKISSGLHLEDLDVI